MFTLSQHERYSVIKITFSSNYFPVYFNYLSFQNTLRFALLSHLYMYITNRKETADIRYQNYGAFNILAL